MQLLFVLNMILYMCLLYDIIKGTMTEWKVKLMPSAEKDGGTSCYIDM